MSVCAEFLAEKWEKITFYDNSFLRLDIAHPLEWYIGYTDIDRKTLFLISDMEIKSMPSSKAMKVQTRRRSEDHRWTLTFELLRNEEYGVFLNFCSDIIIYSGMAENEKRAIELLYNRYNQWDLLFKNQPTGLMTEKTQKGLIGELLYLCERMAQEKDLFEVIEGWVGPDGADQDFVYGNKWYEIKAVNLATDKIQISSIEQLDACGVGELVIIRIDKCSPGKQEAITLNKIVDVAYNLIGQDIVARELFEAKLINYGYIKMPEYDRQKYFCYGNQSYIVDETFPRITRAMLPPQVVSLEYSLSVAAMKAWEKMEGFHGASGIS